jgi:ATP adenylyltransferase
VERLWSPWRLAYVSGASGASGGECIFCRASVPPSNDCQDSHESAALVLVRGRASYVILNRYPYNNGHLLVVPNRHVATLATATAEELSEMIRFTRDAEVALMEAYHAQGINVGINLGQPAGAGIADHMHIHVVPRWSGDTNFMSVVGNVRVLPEELGDTANRLRPIFERLWAAAL